MLNFEFFEDIHPSSSLSAIAPRHELLSAEASVGTLPELVAAEEVLDTLAAQGQAESLEYQRLWMKCKVFVLNNPELIDTGWVRVAGAVFDILCEVREQRLEEAETLTEIALNKAKRR